MVAIVWLLLLLLLLGYPYLPSVEKQKAVTSKLDLVTDVRYVIKSDTTPLCLFRPDSIEMREYIKGEGSESTILRRYIHNLREQIKYTKEHEQQTRYYLRTHLVTDDGFDIVARYSKTLPLMLDSLERNDSLLRRALYGSKFELTVEPRFRIYRKMGFAPVDSMGIYIGGRDSVSMPDGYGMLKSFDGSYYEGSWEHGKRSGVGMQIAPGKRLRLGDWKDDRFLGERMKHTSERIYGIDISRYQHEQGRQKYPIDWEDLRVTSVGAKGNQNVRGKVDYPVRFVYIKATEGLTVLNRYFASDYVSSRQHGYRTGAYHFLSLKTPGRHQAIYFIRNAKYTKGDLPPVLDIEPSEAQIIASGGEEKMFKNIRGWIDAVEWHWGVKPILYVNQGFVNRHLPNAPDLMKGYEVWIARYSEYKPEVNLIYWQLCQDGKVKGIRGDVDINVYNGFVFK